MVHIGVGEAFGCIWGCVFGKEGEGAYVVFLNVLV